MVKKCAARITNTSVFRQVDWMVVAADWSPSMNTLRKRIERFLASEDGPTAVEYAVMLALIVMVCVVSIAAVGNNTSAVFLQASNF